MAQPQRLSEEDRRERAANARALANDSTFITAVADVRADCVNSLIQHAVGTSQAMDDHAILRALDRIQAKLSQWSAEDKSSSRKR